MVAKAEMRVVTDQAMSGSQGGDRSNPSGVGDFHSGTPGSSMVFWGFWVLLFASTLLVSGPWAGFHAILLGGAGLLLVMRPPTVALPRMWWVFAALFGIAGAAAFLPAAWFAMPEWRGKLESLGLDTGPWVAIQARQAAEALALFCVTLIVGLWLAGHRPSPSQLRGGALAFTVGVAVYAVLAKLRYDPESGQGVYGFFKNRNHTATYLAMGSVCGLGNVIQALRDRRFAAMAIALISTAICLWAVASWSISRGGVVLVVFGCLLWLLMTGRRYLGAHGWRLLALLGIAGVGLFLIADIGVKARISSTLEKAGVVIDASPGDAKPVIETPRDLDFRIPTALDTLELIRDFKWTGTGAGQFYYVFPQYRNHTLVANESDHLHPESDWLWLMAEVGIPGTLALAALVIAAFWKSCRKILTERDRALRLACLVSALLVPLHGMFDVPGHQIPLAWAAAFLFSLSLRNSTDEIMAPPIRSWIFRVVGIAMIVTSAYLARAQWSGGPQPAGTVASRAIERSRELFLLDQAAQKKALADEVDYQPAPADDPLEQALDHLQRASRIVPLDRNLLRDQGIVALYFDDRLELVDRVFAIDRVLDPYWVEGPMRQAEALAAIDPRRTLELWKEALRRADRVDRIPSAARSMRQRTLARIRNFAKGRPELESLLPLAE